MIGNLLKVTLADFPGKVACIYFSRGCNMQCPYCYNGNIPPEMQKEGLLEFLQSRKKKLSGVVLSGGEFLLNPLDEVLGLMSEIKSMGFDIKLDTNGTQPDKLQAVLDKGLVDYVAMDVKSDFNGYTNIFKVDPELIYGTAQLLASYALPSEFRTVLTPTIIKGMQIRNIAGNLPTGTWRLSDFQPGNCLDPSFNSIEPYDVKTLERLVRAARTYYSGKVITSIQRLEDN